MNAQHGRLARQHARRQNRERLTGVLLALLGVAVLVVALIALNNKKSTSSSNAADTVSAGASSASTSRPRVTPARSATTSAAPTQLNSSDSAGASEAARQIPLVVLNNTTITGLASQAAQRFESGGWTVSSEGNLVNNIISTCAYYDPSVTGAKAAAQALQQQYPTIKRVRAKFAELPSGPVVVVLTPDYSPG